MDCLDDDLVLRFAQGQLPATQTGGIEQHLSECSDCRHLVAEAARFVSAQPTGTPLGHSGSLPTDVNPVPAAVMQRVGRYQLLEVIGAGGMGVVYTAFDPQLSRNVALKLVRASATNPDVAAKSRARLLREAQAMAQLAHPNVVTVYDAGTHEGQVFVAMELVQGETLKLWLRGQKLSWQKVLEPFLAAGDGLAAAHARGLVHRDFKPDNVLVGTDGRVRVTDFGLARLEFSEPEEPGAAAAALAVRPASMTETGMLLGTPAYMAPEQLRHQPVDARSDQFSFCVALFEALYGHRPFRLTSVEMGPVDFPKEPHVPAPLVAVLSRGLSAAPADRFDSMGELLAALRAALVVKTHRPVGLLVGLSAAGAVAVAALALLAFRPGGGAPAAATVAPPVEAQRPAPAPATAVASPAPTPAPAPAAAEPKEEPPRATVAARPAQAEPPAPARAVRRPKVHSGKSARAAKKGEPAKGPSGDDAPIDNPWGAP